MNVVIPEKTYQRLMAFYGDRGLVERVIDDVLLDHLEDMEK